MDRNRIISNSLDFGYINYSNFGDDVDLPYPDDVVNEDGIYFVDEDEIEVIGYQKCVRTLQEFGAHQYKVRIVVDEPDTRETGEVLRLALSFSHEFSRCIFVGLRERNFSQMCGKYRKDNVAFIDCDVDSEEALHFARATPNLVNVFFGSYTDEPLDLASLLHF